MKKLSTIAAVASVTLAISCSQQSNSTDPTPLVTSTSDQHGKKEVDDKLAEELRSLREANKRLLADLARQDNSITALKALVSSDVKRIDNWDLTFSAYTNLIASYFRFVGDELARHQSAQSNCAWQLLLHQVETGDNTTAVFDASDSGGFSRMNSGSGFFLVSLKNVEPYLEGYKVTFSVGNPFAATYDNLRFDVTWGKRFDPKESEKDPLAFSAWQRELRHKQISIPDHLLPGSWNRITLTLTPAKSDELNYICLKLETSTVSLRTPTDK